MSEFEKYLCPQCGTMQESLKAELARRDEIIKRLKEDGDRLTCVGAADATICPCGYPDFRDTHTPDCPITLHRALMKELE